MQIISLGYNCQPNFVLSKIGKDTQHYCLDSLISYKLERIVELLNNNFSTFFLEENIKVEKSAHYEGFVTVQDQLNEIFSIHDFNPQEEINRELILKKLDFNPFLTNIKSNPNSLIFVRRNKGYEERESTIKLHESIRKLRNGLPFELYVFQSKPYEFSEYENLNFFQDKIWEWSFQKGVWEGDYDLWEKAFCDKK